MRLHPGPKYAFRSSTSLPFAAAMAAAIPAAIMATMPAQADVPSKMEPDYAEAILAYNAKDYERTLALIAQLRKRSPEISEFLELEALALKATHKGKESSATYESLIDVKSKAGRPDSETAPYHYELGTIRMEEKKLEEAKKHFEFAAHNGFSEGASYLYFGMISYSQAQWEDAMKGFRGVVGSDSEDLKPAALLYLSQVEIKVGDTAAATRDLIRARAVSEDVIQGKDVQEEAKKIARQVLERANQALAPLNQGRLFGNVGIMVGEDTNPLTTPIGTPGAIPPPGSTTVGSTARLTFMGGIGYSTSPVRWAQLVVSDRVLSNFNFVSDSRDAQFTTNTLSLYINRHPLEPFSYGLKLESNYIIRGDAQSFFGINNYAVTGSLGPYLRWERPSKWAFGIEGAAMPQSYFDDKSAASSDLMRSGFGGELHLYVQRESGARFFNPLLTFKAGNSGSSGNSFNYNISGLILADTLHLNENLDCTASAEIDKLDYKNYGQGTGGPTGRKDTLVTFLLGATRKINTRVSVIANFTFSNNRTDPDSLASQFGYNRATFDVGLSYGF